MGFCLSKYGLTQGSAETNGIKTPEAGITPGREAQHGNVRTSSVRGRLWFINKLLNIKIMRLDPRRLNFTLKRCFPCKGLYNVDFFANKWEEITTGSWHRCHKGGGGINWLRIIERMNIIIVRLKECSVEWITKCYIVDLYRSDIFSQFYKIVQMK